MCLLLAAAARRQRNVAGIPSRAPPLARGQTSSRARRDGGGVVATRLVCVAAAGAQRCARRALRLRYARRALRLTSHAPRCPFMLRRAIARLR
jgi:hypothetical protein